MEATRDEHRKKLHDIVWSNNAHNDDIDHAQWLERRRILVPDQLEWINETWNRVCGNKGDE